MLYLFECIFWDRISVVDMKSVLDNTRKPSYRLPETTLLTSPIKEIVWCNTEVVASRGNYLRGDITMFGRHQGKDKARSSGGPEEQQLLL